MNTLRNYLIKRAADTLQEPVLDPERAIHAFIPAMQRLAATHPIEGIPTGERLLHILRGTSPHNRAVQQWGERSKQLTDISKQIANLLTDQTIAPEQRRQMLDTMSAPGKFREASSKMTGRMQQDYMQGKVKPYVDRAGRHALRGGVGVLTDALLTDHDDEYSAMDNVTSGVGGILGGVAGTILANKLTNGNHDASMAGNLLGSAIGGWGLNRARRAIFA